MATTSPFGSHAGTWKGVGKGAMFDPMFEGRAGEYKAEWYFFN